MRQPVFGLFFLFLVVGIIWPISIVFAQVSSSPSSSPQPTSSAPLDQDAAAQMSTLRSQYRTQLDVYRTDEHNFSLSRDQYNQLQTLTALEEAVKSTQKVLLSRDEVLLTYLKMLRLTFTQTTGVQLQLKNNQLKIIDALIMAINRNKDLASHAVTRVQADQAALDFAAFSPLLQQISSQTILIMSYGKVQSLFDKTVTVRNEIKTHVLQQETDPLKLSEKQRAFVQIDQTVDLVDFQLKGVLAGLSGGQNFQTTQTGEQLNQAYAGISRTFAYLDEVLAH